MTVPLLAATGAAALVLAASLQWLAAVLRELPSEHRPRRVGRAGPTAVAPLPPDLRQLERLAEEALAGDRHAVARLTGLATSAAHRSGVTAARAGARPVSSPAELLATLDHLEAAVAAAQGDPPSPGGALPGGDGVWPGTGRW